MSDTTGLCRTSVLCPCQAPSPVLSVKSWKSYPLDRPSQAGDRPFHTPWISLKLFCLHHPDAGTPSTVTGHRAKSKPLIKHGVWRVSVAGAPKSGDLNRCCFPPTPSPRPPETKDPGISKAHPQYRDALPALLLRCGWPSPGVPQELDSPVPHVAVHVVQEPKRQRNSACSISFSLSAGRWMVYWYRTPGLVS